MNARTTDYRLRTTSFSRRGFTLTEMLIAIVLISLLTLVIAKILLTNTRVFTKNTINSAFQTDARLTMRYLQEDIKSTRRIAEPQIDQSATVLSLSLADRNGVQRSVQYFYQEDGVLVRNYFSFDPSDPMGMPTTRRVELARDLVNDNDNPIFTRTSENGITINMNFRNSAMPQDITFDFSTSLNLKNKVLLTVYRDNIDFNLNAVYLTDSANGWAVGQGGSILRFTNNNWSDWVASNPPPVTNQNLNSVFIMNDELGYAAGENGTFLSFQIPSWNLWPATAGNLNKIYVEDANEIMAVGSSGNNGIVKSYNGTNWTEISIANRQLNDIAQYSNNTFAVGNAFNNIGSVYRITAGPNAQQITDGHIPNNNLNGVSLIANSNTPNINDYYMWVAGDSGTVLWYQSDDDRWSNIEGWTNARLNSVYFFEDDNGFIVGEGGIILRWDGSTLERLESPTNENLTDVFLYGNDGGWIVGDNGTRIKIGEF